MDIQAQNNYYINEHMIMVDQAAKTISPVAVSTSAAAAITNENKSTQVECGRFDHIYNNIRMHLMDIGYQESRISPSHNPYYRFNGSNNNNAFLSNNDALQYYRNKDHEYIMTIGSLKMNLSLRKIFYIPIMKDKRIIFNMVSPWIASVVNIHMYAKDMPGYVAESLSQYRTGASQLKSKSSRQVSRRMTMCEKMGLLIHVALTSGINLVIKKYDRTFANSDLHIYLYGEGDKIRRCMLISSDVYGGHEFRSMIYKMITGHAPVMTSSSTSSTQGMFTDMDSDPVHNMITASGFLNDTHMNSIFSCMQYRRSIAYAIAMAFMHWYFDTLCSSDITNIIGVHDMLKDICDIALVYTQCFYKNGYHNKNITRTQFTEQNVKGNIISILQDLRRMVINQVTD